MTDGSLHQVLIEIAGDKLKTHKAILGMRFDGMWDVFLEPLPLLRRIRRWASGDMTPIVELRGGMDPADVRVLVDRIQVLMKGDDRDR